MKKKEKEEYDLTSIMNTSCETIGMANLKTSFSFVSAPGIHYLCAIF